MNRWTKILALAVLALGAGPWFGAGLLAQSQPPGWPEIRSVTVDGQPVNVGDGQKVNLGPSPKHISFGFTTGAPSPKTPLRVHYKLDGYDAIWHEAAGEMYLAIRFYNNAGDVIGQSTFYNTGDSLGWHGKLEGLSLTHRHETITVPPQASKLWAVISSAGPPATVGIFVVDDLVISRLSSSNAPEVILRSPFDRLQKEDFTSQNPHGWVRDGTHPSMAKILGLGTGELTKAFAIVDDDPIGHAEWHNTMESAPKITPGDQLVVEWNEMFSMGVADVLVANYDALPAGNFTFRVQDMTIMGKPLGADTFLEVVVAAPLWKNPWFWGVAFLAVMSFAFLASRYFIWYRMRQEMALLKQQQILERERVRIARDIHDDLGARITQISLVSGMARRGVQTIEKAQADFSEISAMSRELVSALYETIWAVDPENDNLDALGNYLCQTVNKLCESVELRCRFNVMDMPSDVQVSSQIRHNLIMAVREAVHNTIKHAEATELAILMKFEKPVLTISIEDNGRGFQIGAKPPGNGLRNMERRLKGIGGEFSIQSRPGGGTKVLFRLQIKPA